MKFDSLISLYRKITFRVRGDYIAAHSGHSALFIIISVFPLLILMLALVSRLGLEQNELLKLLGGLAPKGFQGDIFSSVSGIVERLGSVAVSMTILTLLWSASGFIYSVTLGLNRIYRYEENRNYFLLRGISLLYTLVFLMLLLLIVGLTALMGWAKSAIATRLGSWNTGLNFLEGILYFALMLFVSALFYSFIPKKKSKLLNQLPGAVFTSLSWYGFSFVYPIYLRFSDNVSYIYGGLSMAILWLWWLYFSMYIFYIGAELNVHLSLFKKENTLKKDVEND